MYAVIWNIMLFYMLLPYADVWLYTSQTSSPIAAVLAQGYDLGRAALALQNAVCAAAAVVGVGYLVSYLSPLLVSL